MEDNIKRKLDARAKILKALAHPTRLFVIDKLREREHCVCEMTEMIGADISTVSKHLAILKNSGIIDDRKDGTRVFYRLEADCVVDFFKCLENILKYNIERQKEII